MKVIMKVSLICLILILAAVAILIFSSCQIRHYRLEVHNHYSISISESGSVSLANSTVFLTNARLEALTDSNGRVIFYPMVQERIRNLVSNDYTISDATNWTEWRLWPPGWE